MSRKTIMLALAALAVLGLVAQEKSTPQKPMNTADTAPQEPEKAVEKTDEEWKKILTPEQYRVLRESGTERPHGEVYKQFKDQGAGTYYCAGCGAELFSSEHKFDAHCGWPAFYDGANNKNLLLIKDLSHGMIRTEVQCAKCKGHLGHLFSGEGFNTPKDQRYCINGVTLLFVPKGEKPPSPAPEAEKKK